MGRFVFFLLLLSPPLISPHHTYFYIQHSIGRLFCNKKFKLGANEIKRVCVLCINNNRFYRYIARISCTNTTNTGVVIYLLYQYNTSSERSSHTCLIYSTPYIENDEKKEAQKNGGKAIQRSLCTKIKTACQKIIINLLFNVRID